MANLMIKDFPDDLYERLRRQAQRRRRSISQEVIHLLSQPVGLQSIRSVLEFQGFGKDIWHSTDVIETIDGEPTRNMEGDSN